jgi:hypothetical protein
MMTMMMMMTISPCRSLMPLPLPTHLPGHDPGVIPGRQHSDPSRLLIVLEAQPGQRYPELGAHARNGQGGRGCQRAETVDREVAQQPTAPLEGGGRGGACQCHHGQQCLSAVYFISIFIVSSSSSSSPPLYSANPPHHSAETMACWHARGMASSGASAGPSATTRE